MAQDPVNFDVRTGTRVLRGTRFVERQSRFNETVDYGTRPPGGGRSSAAATAPDLKRVLLKQNGVDGDGRPVYDVFDPADTGLLTPLNDAPLTPENGRWRGADGLDITAAEDGSPGIAYLNADGHVIGLLTDAETICASEETGLTVEVV